MIYFHKRLEVKYDSVYVQMLETVPLTLTRLWSGVPVSFSIGEPAVCDKVHEPGGRCETSQAEKGENCLYVELERVKYVEAESSSRRLWRGGGIQPEGTRRRSCRTSESRGLMRGVGTGLSDAVLSPGRRLRECVPGAPITHGQKRELDSLARQQ